MRRVNKHGNIRTKVGGKVFDSRLEARRYTYLSLLEKAGEISDLRTQVKFELIPAQYREVITGGVYTRGENKGKPKIKKVCIERGVDYYADFVYNKKTPLGEWITVVEDTKGHRTEAYKIKRKLMLYIHNINIKEVKDAGECT